MVNRSVLFSERPNTELHRYKSCCDTIFQMCPQSGLSSLGLRVMSFASRARSEMVC
jgi:hypothetical protein